MPIETRNVFLGNFALLIKFKKSVLSFTYSLVSAILTE